MKANPKKDQGERFFDCPQYESCLDFAAIQNWKAFNCESCDFYINATKETPASLEEKVKARICEECGKNPTIQPSSPLCASCIGKQAWKGRKAKNKGPSELKSKKTTQNKAKPEKSQKDLNTALTIEFGKYASVLSEIKKIAEEEVRSIDLQIIYILKRYLSKADVSKSV